MEKENYLAVLNEAQKEAVIHTGSPLLILAGAGSGKTRVITTKIAYMISELNVSPSSILALTFTKKAAGEMKERAVTLEPRASYAQLRTFHSFGAYFLRCYAEESDTGVSPNFTVYDDDDMVTLITKAVPTLTKKDASHYAHKISLAKDYCLTPDSPGLLEIESDPFFQTVYAEYENRLRKTGNVDFGDLILLPYLILRENETVRLSVQHRYKVILVDEYQDSNVAQFKLLQQLSGFCDGKTSGTYVCVVGDDDQSIYKFRGAEVQNILGFQNHFPGTKIVRLESNYRSTEQILNCASSVVKNNSGRLGKELVAERGQGKKPALVFLPTQDDETEFCTSLITQAHDSGIPYSDWAVLYRTNAQSLGFETEFLHNKIPYSVVGSLKFYEREEIKDAVSWLSFIVNQRDEISFRRIVNKPVRGIGNTTQEKIVALSLEEDIGICEAGKKIKLAKKAREGMDFFSSLLDEFISLLPESEDGDSENLALAAAAIDGDSVKKKDGEKLSKFVDAVIKKSGLEDFHRDQDKISGSQKVGNLEELVNSALLYPCSRQGLLDFLDHINLDRTLEREDDGTDEDRVTLITLHNTKGLEFPRVIITGMERGIFPRENKTEDEIEEERRLFYVGITRAQDELYFTSCGLRRLYGRTDYMAPSIFLSELGDDNVRILGKKPASFSASHTEDDPVKKKYCKGASVFHDDFGYGVIVRGEMKDEEYLVTVSFENCGIKKFLPKYQSSKLIVTQD